MNNEERDRRVMLALNHLGIAHNIEAYCNEWTRQFGTEAPSQNPRFPDLLPVPPFPTGPAPENAPRRNLAVPVQDWRDKQISDLHRELYEANETIRGFEGFWERAADAIGLQHPARLIDPAPERAYQRGNRRFDDGWRHFTEEDVLGYLRSIGRISSGMKIVNGGKR